MHKIMTFDNFHPFRFSNNGGSWKCSDSNLEEVEGWWWLLTSERVGRIWDLFIYSSFKRHEGKMSAFLSDTNLFSSARIYIIRPVAAELKGDIWVLGWVGFCLCALPSTSKVSAAPLISLSSFDSPNVLYLKKWNKDVQQYPHSSFISSPYSHPWRRR